MRTRALHAGVQISLVALAVLLVASSSLAAESIVGTWKLNVAKSTYSPGPGPKSVTLKIEPAGAGIKVTTDGVNADGTPIHSSYSVNFDRKEIAATGLPNRAETIAYRKLDDYTYESVSRAKGKIVATNRIVISKDGNIRTGTSTGTTVDGKPLRTVVIFEKQ